jgi:hypothetical protein
LVAEPFFSPFFILPVIERMPFMFHEMIRIALLAVNLVILRFIALLAKVLSVQNLIL